MLGAVLHAGQAFALMHHRGDLQRGVFIALLHNPPRDFDNYNRWYEEALDILDRRGYVMRLGSSINVSYNDMPMDKLEHVPTPRTQ